METKWIILLSLTACFLLFFVFLLRAKVIKDENDNLYNNNDEDNYLFMQKNKMKLTNFQNLGEQLMSLSMDYLNDKILFIDYDLKFKETTTAMRMLIDIENCELDKMKMKWMYNMYIDQAISTAQLKEPGICLN